VARGRQPRDLILNLGLESLNRDLPAEAASLLAAYVGLLAKWNRRVNLVSSTEDRILRPLLGEAVWAAGRYPTGSCSHLDIGSGAGFPALPFAILRPDVTFVLLEARARRAAFLETTAYELGLRNVRVVAGRLDRYLRTLATPGPWGCVSWKGIKLDRKELSQLLSISSRDARLWVFHGADLPLDAQTVKESLMLNWREPCPCHSGWFLSEYVPRLVSRETT